MAHAACGAYCAYPRTQQVQHALVDVSMCGSILLQYGPADPAGGPRVRAAAASKGCMRATVLGTGAPRARGAHGGDGARAGKRAAEPISLVTVKPIIKPA